MYSDIYSTNIVTSIVKLIKMHPIGQFIGRGKFCRDLKEQLFFK